MEVGHPVTCWALDALDRTEPCGTSKSACKRACESSKGSALPKSLRHLCCARGTDQAFGSSSVDACSCRVHQGDNLIAQSLWHKVRGHLHKGANMVGRNASPDVTLIKQACKNNIKSDRHCACVLASMDVSTSQYQLATATADPR